jgi:hypothetical protein
MAAILTLAATAYLVMNAQCPPLYFGDDSGRVARSTVVFSRGLSGLCVAIIAPRGSVEERHSAFSFFRPLMVRSSIGSGYGWIIDICDRYNDGLRPFTAEVYLLHFENMTKKESGIDCESGQPPIGKAVRDVREENGGSWSKAILESFTLNAGAIGILEPHEGKPGWTFTPYNDLLLKLLRASRGGTVRYVPYCTICAVDAHKAIIAMYLNGTIAFTEITISPKAKADKGNAATRPSSIDGVLLANPIAGPLNWRSVGSTETSINTWSTALWSDNLMHLISDDGKYERFKLVDGKMARVDRLSDLPPQSALCQGSSRIWILSETDNGIRATEIMWREKPQRRDHDLGDISLDQAAVKVLESSEK